jgi:hypothetical protein
MNMFRNMDAGERLFVGLAATGGVVAAWAGLLWALLGLDNGALWFLLTGQLVGLAAYAGAMALLPDPETT